MADTRPQAVIFDSDGTMLNSFELILAAYHHVAVTHGLRPPTADEVRSQLGKALPDIFRTFYPNHDVTELLHTNSQFIAENVMRSEAFGGLEDMLRTLHDVRRLKLAVLTGGNHKIHDLLAHHGIDRYFTSVVHCDRAVKPKPDPEGFLLAAQECSVLASTAIGVGDTANDILASKRAGAFATIGVTHGFGSRESLIAAGADYLANNLPEVLQVIETL